MKHDLLQPATVDDSMDFLLLSLIFCYNFSGKWSC